MITANPRSFRATPRARVRISHELYVRCYPILPVFSERGVVRRHGDSGNGGTGNLVRLIPSLILRNMAYAIRRYRMKVVPFSKRRMTWLAQRKCSPSGVARENSRSKPKPTQPFVTCWSRVGWIFIQIFVHWQLCACLGYRPHSNLALVWHPGRFL